MQVAAKYGAAVGRQTEGKQKLESHCQNSWMLLKFVHFGARLDAGRGPTGPLSWTRWTVPRHRGPGGRHGRFGVFVLSYV